LQLLSISRLYYVCWIMECDELKQRIDSLNRRHHYFHMAKTAFDELFDYKCLCLNVIRWLYLILLLNTANHKKCIKVFEVDKSLASSFDRFNLSIGKVCAQGYNFVMHFLEIKATVTFEYYYRNKCVQSNFTLLCVEIFQTVSFLYNKDLKLILIRIWQR